MKSLLVVLVEVSSEKGTVGLTGFLYGIVSKIL